MWVHVYSSRRETCLHFGAAISWPEQLRAVVLSQCCRSLGSCPKPPTTICAVEGLLESTGSFDCKRQPLGPAPIEPQSGLRVGSHGALSGDCWLLPGLLEDVKKKNAEQKQKISSQICLRLAVGRSYFLRK